MKQTSFLMLGAAVAASSAFAAQARADDGYVPAFMRDGGYVRAEGGWNNTDDDGYNTSSGRVNAKYDAGYLAGGALGVQRGNMRYEAEALHSHAGVKNLNVAGVNAPNSDGSTSLNALMGNVYYDFGNGRLKPYIGGGAGVGRLSVNNHNAAGTTYADDSDTVFAYQGMAGVRYDLNPCWALNAEYRYLGSNDGEISTLGGRSKVAYDSNNVIVGLSYKF